MKTFWIIVLSCSMLAGCSKGSQPSTEKADLITELYAIEVEFYEKDKVSHLFSAGKPQKLPKRMDLEAMPIEDLQFLRTTMQDLMNTHERMNATLSEDTNTVGVTAPNKFQERTSQERRRSE